MALKRLKKEEIAAEEGRTLQRPAFEWQPLEQALSDRFTQKRTAAKSLRRPALNNV